MIPVAPGPLPGEQRSCGADFDAVAAPMLGCGLGLDLVARGDEAHSPQSDAWSSASGAGHGPNNGEHLEMGAQLVGLMRPATGEVHVLVPGQPEIWGAGGGPRWALFPARAELAAPSSVD
ncbi:hypothetical protein NDU88_005167 [Pleurodeles waltl]|uniref:Uncharacterized protein n=1 Tax=Pleurodeles waltl TaxID=8319 RepID=A0AAV7LT25_PLEWA|nr:hypothetical protein NDU88_005167 [Pleurodeles waltl]